MKLKNKNPNTNFISFLYIKAHDQAAAGCAINLPQPPQRITDLRQHWLR
jgi:hypothetical protein